MKFLSLQWLFQEAVYCNQYMEILVKQGIYVASYTLPNLFLPPMESPFEEVCWATSVNQQ